jgi:hypothetical protein
MPGASRTARRPGPRPSSSSSWRSSAATKPAPYMTSERRLPVMCGTPHLSRTMRTFLFGVFSTFVGPWPRVPNTLGL